MSRMIKYLSIAVVLFSVAASASWYMQYRQLKDADPSKTGDEKPSKSVVHGATPVKSDDPDGAPKRPLIRPPTSLEAERISQLAAALKQQQESLQSRETHVANREKQMNLIHEEIKKDQKKLEVMRKEIQTELQLVQEKLEMLEKLAVDGTEERKKVEAQKEEIRKSMFEVGTLETKNLKQLASIFDKMDPEAASQSIQQMIDQGKAEMAVTILFNMGNRQAAAVLGDIAKQDSSIAVQLADRVRLMKTAPSIAPK